MKSNKVHALFLFCCRDKIIGLFVNKEKCIFMNDDIVSIFSLAALQVFSPPVEHILKWLRAFGDFKVCKILLPPPRCISLS